MGTVVKAKPTLMWLRAANSPDSGLDAEMNTGGCGFWTGLGQMEMARNS
jgi:hypothetical protein